LDDQPCEFPRVNDQFIGLPTRYGYAALQPESSLEGMAAFKGLIKYDLQTGRSHSYELKAHQYCGEAVFAPRPGAHAEDNGWLLTFAHDYAENRSELLVFDAQHLNAAPIARVIVPKRVPFGFHGLWVPEV
jgi:carotenoid cleavage dioxygenase